MSATCLTISQCPGVWMISSRFSVAPHPVMIPCRLGRSGWELSGRQILALHHRPDVRIVVPRDWLY